MAAAAPAPAVPRRRRIGKTRLALFLGASAIFYVNHDTFSDVSFVCAWLSVGALAIAVIADFIAFYLHGDTSRKPKKGSKQRKNGRNEGAHADDDGDTSDDDESLRLSPVDLIDSDLDEASEETSADRLPLPDPQASGMWAYPLGRLAGLGLLAFMHTYFVPRPEPPIAWWLARVAFAVVTGLVVIDMRPPRRAVREKQS